MSAPQTVADVLEAAAKLIEPEGAWTQGSLARDENGRMVLPRDADACCWCASGAIMHYGGDAPNDAWSNFSATIGGVIPHWNDHQGRTQAEVVAKLREAAALAREQGL
ncbi:DUF6197 family protein [Sphingomonas baiyangensis]|uniref:Uncharacterized protein n=1 Tax=Sphingomonas baiyangensis TaxID=2572576 RepID=A0A4U1L1Z6_9SPHN|nr:hypothetical protein [Sphingomonas baiyangensis]TKD50193.1 hypothetical protein FBR43_05065 [Sphingomonas baiyangensis]